MSLNFKSASAEDISVKQWWDSAHEENCSPDLQGYLTGSSGIEVWQRLDVDQRLKPGSRVLNIGVGLGNCTFALAHRGCEVHAVDISETALSKVKTICTSCYLADNLNELPSNYFSIAISHLVTQHISNQMLATQLREVIRALSADGIFAMQVADLFDKGRFDSPDESPKALKHGGVCRSLGFMEKMIYEAGGDITMAKRCGIFPQYGSGWYALHITPRRMVYSL